MAVLFRCCTRRYRDSGSGRGGGGGNADGCGRGGGRTGAAARRFRGRGRFNGGGGGAARGRRRRRRRRRRGGGRDHRRVHRLVDEDAEPERAAAELGVVARARDVAARVDDRAGRGRDVAAEALEARLQARVPEAQPDARVDAHLDGHVQAVQAGLRRQGALRVRLVREAAQVGPPRREDHVNAAVSHVEAQRGRRRERECGRERA